MKKVPSNRLKRQSLTHNESDEKSTHGQTTPKNATDNNNNHNGSPTVSNVDVPKLDLNHLAANSGDVKGKLSAPGFTDGSDLCCAHVTDMRTATAEIL